MIIIENFTSFLRFTQKILIVCKLEKRSIWKYFELRDRKFKRNICVTSDKGSHILLEKREINVKCIFWNTALLYSVVRDPIFSASLTLEMSELLAQINDAHINFQRSSLISRLCTLSTRDKFMKVAKQTNYPYHMEIPQYIFPHTAAISQIN